MNCPCGSERTFEQCCGPYLAGAPAPTAEALMRSRYTAYVRGEIDYIVATHDPDTRDSVDRGAIEAWSRGSTWLGLSILKASAGSAQDASGEVEFIARWRKGREESVHHEHSRFKKVDGRWYYVEAFTPKREPVRVEARPPPNAPCPCGSGKKYKRCHGV